MVGIIIAIILRGIFIALGAVVINAYAWVFYIFGAFLVYTAVKLATGGESDDDEYHENRLLALGREALPGHQGVERHAASRSIENGKRLITPMLIVILALGTTDLLFALDSIPAIYGLTKEPFLVLTANIFALMGLRQLYFLIGGLLKKLVYLSIGLAVLLAFIGVKLVMHALHENNLPFINGGGPIEGVPDIPILVSLGAIVLILGVTTVASLWKSRRDARLEPADAVPAAGSAGRRATARPRRQRRTTLREAAPPQPKSLGLSTYEPAPGNRRVARRRRRLAMTSALVPQQQTPLGIGDESSTHRDERGQVTQAVLGGLEGADELADAHGGQVRGRFIGGSEQGLQVGHVNSKAVLGTAGVVSWEGKRGPHVAPRSGGARGVGRDCEDTFSPPRRQGPRSRTGRTTPPPVDRRPRSQARSMAPRSGPGGRRPSR